MPTSGGNLDRSSKALLNRADLPAVRFHDLRHTWDAAGGAMDAALG